MGRISTMTLLYTVLGALMFAFFVWLLMNMASTSDRASFILTTLGISFLIVIAAVALGAIAGRRSNE